MPFRGWGRRWVGGPSQILPKAFPNPYQILQILTKSFKSLPNPYQILQILQILKEILMNHFLEGLGGGYRVLNNRARNLSSMYARGWPGRREFISRSGCCFAPPLSPIYHQKPFGKSKINQSKHSREQGTQNSGKEICENH